MNQGVSDILILVALILSVLIASFFFFRDILVAAKQSKLSDQMHTVSNSLFNVIIVPAIAALIATFIIQPVSDSVYNVGYVLLFICFGAYGIAFTLESARGIIFKVMDVPGLGKARGFKTSGKPAILWALLFVPLACCFSLVPVIMIGNLLFS